MTPATREKLQTAWDWAKAQLLEGKAPVDIIAGLQAEHGATCRLRPHTNTLRCCGVTASCTWSQDKGLLDAWCRVASLKLVMENYA